MGRSYSTSLYVCSYCIWESARGTDLDCVTIDTHALYALASPRVPQAVRDEVIDRAQAGERITKAEAQDMIRKALAARPDAIERIQNNAATARERVQAAAIGTKAEDKMAQGRPAKKRQIAGYTQEDRAGENEVSERTQRKLDHLAEHRPDLLAQVQAGKIATCRAYDIARGIQKTPLNALQSAWRKADQEVNRLTSDGV
jgi:hypothetical protein